MLLKSFILYVDCQQTRLLNQINKKCLKTETTVRIREVIYKILKLTNTN